MVETTEKTESKQGKAGADDVAARGRRLEAALLTAERPLPAAKLAEVLSDADAAQVREAIDALNAHYEQTQRSFRVEEVAGGYQIHTLPDYADVIDRLHRSRSQSKLSVAAMETLAIVAYKQPIVRAEIEAIRGVACGEMLRALLERHLIKIVGRAEEIGRPMLYGTTKKFLELFGLGSLKDLPKVEELNLGKDNP